MADWLGHGRPDLIVTGAGGDVVLLPNDGGATEPRFGHPVAIRCEGHPLILPPCVQPAIAGWSEPDTLDLIALDLQGFLCAYPQVDRDEVGPPIPIVDHLGRLIRLDGSFGLSGRCSIWAGPWTAPDRVDLLIGLPRGNRHVVAAVTGIPLESVDSLPTVLLLENLGRNIVAPRPLRVPRRSSRRGRRGRMLSPRASGERDSSCRTCWWEVTSGCLTWIARDELSLVDWANRAVVAARPIEGCQLGRTILDGQAVAKIPSAERAGCRRRGLAVSGQPAAGRTRARRGADPSGPHRGIRARRCTRAVRDPRIRCPRRPRAGAPSRPRSRMVAPVRAGRRPGLVANRASGDRRCWCSSAGGRRSSCSCTSRWAPSSTACRR